MAQQIGRELLIKGGDGAASEQFTTICGFLARAFSINNNLVDTTVPDCALPGGIVREATTYGVQAVAFNGSGFFDSDAAGVAVANAALNQTTRNYEVIVPGWGTFKGSFKIENFQLSGDKEGSMEFEATFRLSGTATFTAA